MALELIVKTPFGKWKVGDHITLEADIQSALEARPMDVIKINRPEPPIAPVDPPISHLLG